MLEAGDGLLPAMGPGKVWMEMSTTDEAEVRRLGEKVAALGGEPVDCPVSGGCHRADTGNISIFAGCERSTFERILPLLTTMGRRILHTGPLGSASILKVVTNYLATANLVSCCEALVTAKAAGMDLNTTWEAMRISSGNSFVHETESQVILNGSRDISFTMDLVRKDIGLFQAIADRHRVPVELNPVMVEIFKDGEARYGAREWSPNIVRRLEDATGLSILAPGFPAQMIDDEPEAPGYEVVPKRAGLNGRDPRSRGAAHRPERAGRRRVPIRRAGRRMSHVRKAARTGSASWPYRAPRSGYRPPFPESRLVPQPPGHDLGQDLRRPDHVRRVEVQRRDSEPHDVRERGSRR